MSDNRQIAAAAAPGALMGFIERASRDPDFDIAKFGALLDRQIEYEKRIARQRFDQAMAEVQAELGQVTRDKKNPHIHTSYATLSALDAVARPVYTKHGFSVRYGSGLSPRPDYQRIVCVVSHADGHFEENYLDAPSDLQTGAKARSPVQSVGSTVTYLRRYLLMMVLNIVLIDDETDDDGEGTRRYPEMARGAPSSMREYAQQQATPKQPKNGTISLDDETAQACTYYLACTRKTHLDNAKDRTENLQARLIDAGKHDLLDQLNDAMADAFARIAPASNGKPDPFDLSLNADDIADDALAAPIKR